MFQVLNLAIIGLCDRYRLYNSGLRPRGTEMDETLMKIKLAITELTGMCDASLEKIKTPDELGERVKMEAHIIEIGKTIFQEIESKRHSDNGIDYPLAIGVIDSMTAYLVSQCNQSVNGFFDERGNDDTHPEIISASIFTDRVKYQF